MSVKVILLVLLFSIKTNARVASPNFNSSLIYFSQYLKISIKDVENQFKLCFSNQEDCSSLYLFFWKINPKKAYKYSFDIINKYKKSRYIWSISAQIQALNGNFKYLEEDIASSYVSYEDAWIYAKNQNFKYSEIITAPLFNSANDFCNISPYLTPFLKDKFALKNQLVKTVIKNIFGLNNYNHICAYRIMEENQFLSQEVNYEINANLIKLLQPDSAKYSDSYDEYIKLWYRKNYQNKELTNHIIHFFLKKYILGDNRNKPFILYDLYLSNLKIETPKNIQKRGLEKVNINEGIIMLTPVEFVLNKKFDQDWILYLNESYENQLIELFISLLNNRKIVGRNIKIAYILQSNKLKKIFYSQLLLNEASHKEFQHIFGTLLNEKFKNSNALQKTALIGRYPKHFATKPVVRVKTTDPWIKLAEVTNLLTICKIEVPAIGSELSDPKILTKYLEKAETLLKDCNRINK